LTMAGANGDLAAKYQRLATEYAKLKAQIPVLKKAVIDEQTKTNDLNNVLKESQQQNRRFEQEIDSLNFRNQQLTKRVTVLQEEAEQQQLSSKKKQKKGQQQAGEGRGGGCSIEESVLENELHSKIEENASLHQRIYDLEEEQRRALAELEARVSSAERGAAQSRASLNAAQEEKAEATKVFRQERAILEGKVYTLERDYAVALQRGADLESEVQSMKDTLQRHIESAVDPAQPGVAESAGSKASFHDTADNNLNALNVPTQDYAHLSRQRQNLSTIATIISDFVAHTSNLYTYFDQRIQNLISMDIYGSDSAHKETSALLRENSKHVRPLEASFQNLHQAALKSDTLLVGLEGSILMKSFVEALSKFVDYADDVVAALTRTLEEEAMGLGNASSIGPKTKSLCAALPKWGEAVRKIHSRLVMLVSLAEGGTTTTTTTTTSSIVQNGCDESSDTAPSDREGIFADLLESTNQLNHYTKEISKLLSAKITLEHQLPTTTSDFRSTNDCIVSSLIALVTCTSKAAKCLSDNHATFVKPVGFKTRGSSVSLAGKNGGPSVHPVVEEFCQRAADYVALVNNRPVAESVPYAVAVDRSRAAADETLREDDRNQLLEEIVGLKEKVVRLEQDREHWMLETQLVRIKSEKNKNRMAEEEEEKGGGGGGKREGKEAAAEEEAENGIRLGIVSVEDADADADADASSRQSREDVIKEHYTLRIHELTAQLQVADSKSLHFYTDSITLQNRHAMLEKAKKKLEGDLSSALESISQLKDELLTTSRSYEDQLSMMSEHLAGMNDKLTSQKDQIDSLVIQLKEAQQGKKKK